MVACEHCYPGKIFIPYFSFLFFLFLHIFFSSCSLPFHLFIFLISQSFHSDRTNNNNSSSSKQRAPSSSRKVFLALPVLSLINHSYHILFLHLTANTTDSLSLSSLFLTFSFSLTLTFPSLTNSQIRMLLLLFCCTLFSHSL